MKLLAPFSECSPIQPASVTGEETLLGSNILSNGLLNDGTHWGAVANLISEPLPHRNPAPPEPASEIYCRQSPQIIFSEVREFTMETRLHCWCVEAFSSVGAERTSYLVSDMDAAIRAARASGADVLVHPFNDPIGRDAIIQWPGGVNTQLYWHTIAPSSPPLQTIPENRVYDRL
jgi:hypothetical protein